MAWPSLTEAGRNRWSDRLRARQEQVIAHLVAAPTVRDAARASGVSERTIRRWMRSEAFRSAYKRARRAAAAETTRRLENAATRAVDALERVLADVAAPVGARIAACRVVLEFATRRTELEEIGELAERVEALEAHRAERDGGHDA